MSTLRSRYAGLAGVASLMLGASIATAGAASAVVPHYGEHGADVTAVTAYNNADVLAVTSGAYDAPVVAGAAGSASEFVVRKSGDVIVLEYAPFGFAGTPALCVSDPGPGYGAADVIELRDCNGSIFQQFTEFSDGNGYVSLRDNATHQFITDEGQGVGVAGIKDGVVGEPGNNSPSFAADQLWKVGAARAYVAPQPAGYQGCNLHLGASTPDIFDSAVTATPGVTTHVAGPYSATLTPTGAVSYTYAASGTGVSVLPSGVVTLANATDTGSVTITSTGADGSAEVVTYHPVSVSGSNVTLGSETTDAITAIKAAAAHGSGYGHCDVDVTVTGGTAPVTYTVSPALPSGVTLNDSTGVISGVHNAPVSASQNYTVTATDTDGATASVTFSLAVTG